MQIFAKKKKAPYMGWAFNSRTRYHKLKDPFKPNKKKIRGARKKEAIRLEKELNPKGRKMYKKPAPEHRSFVCSKDIEKLMHLDPRPARRYLTRVRKLLKKPPREIVTLSEFCKATPWKEEEVIPYLV